MDIHTHTNKENERNLKNFLVNNLYKKQIYVLISCLMLIRIFQKKISADSTFYHFGYPISKIQNPELFIKMKNIKWLLPHFGDSINTIFNNIFLMHIFSAIISFSAFWILNKIVKNILITKKLYSSDYFNNSIISFILIFSGQYFYTLASGHTEPLILLFCLISTLLCFLFDCKKSYLIVLTKNSRFIYFLSGAFIGLALISKLSFVYFYPQIFLLNCLIVFNSNKFHQLRYKELISYILISILSTVFVVIIYFFINPDVFYSLLTILGFYTNNEFLEAYNFLRQHIYQFKSEGDLTIINSIIYQFKLAFNPFYLRFPFYISFYLNLAISYISIIFIIFNASKSKFLYKNRLYQFLIYFLFFYISTFLYYRSGLHNPRHMFIPITYLSLFIFYCEPSILYSLSKKIPRIILSISFFFILYFESFGLNLPSFRSFNYQENKSNHESFRKLVANTPSKSNILNLFSSEFNSYIPRFAHYPSIYWQYGIDFKKKSFNLNTIKEDFQYIIYLEIEKKTINKNGECKKVDNDEYFFISNDGKSKYQEFKEILLNCSKEIGSIQIKRTNSNTLRNNFKTYKVILAKL